MQRDDGACALDRWFVRVPGVDGRGRRVRPAQADVVDALLQLADVVEHGRRRRL